jgi:hypothetical protein
MSNDRRVLRLSGYAPALPTPFDDAGEIDVATFEWLCLRQIEQAPPRWSHVAPPARLQPWTAPSTIAWFALQSPQRKAAFS